MGRDYPIGVFPAQVFGRRPLKSRVSTNGPSQRPTREHPANPVHPTKATTVTLHIYAPAHDACLAFDVDKRTCARRELAYDPPLA